ncbi:MAG: DUF192 domain-containing protein [Ferrovibrio sp.]|uniref:DUF192 domain-containing protein n=1 Tax=Ferrovibrio sp. TaxID=1917215 RepID=UPI00391C4852
MKLKSVCAVLLSVILFSASFMFSAWAQPQPTLPQSELVIVTSGKGPQRFTVELADNDQSRARGMMFRQSMAPDAGMLFDFKQEQMASFWMRNTLIPLDMIFIKADGTILNIHQRAIPRDETGINSTGPVRAVLEVNGGTASRLGIKPGDRVQHAIFGNPPKK